jgi:hypothetical protein
VLWNMHVGGSKQDGAVCLVVWFNRGCERAIDCCHRNRIEMMALHHMANVCAMGCDCGCVVVT